MLAQDVSVVLRSIAICGDILKPNEVSRLFFITDSTKST